MVTDNTKFHVFNKHGILGPMTTTVFLRNANETLSQLQRSRSEFAINYTLSFSLCVWDILFHYCRICINATRLPPQLYTSPSDESITNYPCPAENKHLYMHWILDLYSLSGRMSHRKISWSLEAARFGFRLSLSAWNLTGISAAAAEVPVKFQSYTIIITSDFTASRLHEIWQ